jgi:uncharacterized phage protein gp47/JayE
MAVKTAIKSPNTIRKEMIKNISERTGVNYWGRDGVARTFVDIITSEQRLAEGRVEASLKSIQLGTAEKEDLDALAESKGLFRMQPTYAESVSNEKNFMFYSNTTFGDLNGGASIVIPAGTKIGAFSSSFTANNISENNIVEYVTTKEYTLPSTMSFYFCSIKSVSSGSFQNVAENTLLKHDFTNYISGQLLCKNNYAILNGRNIESDDSLRFRAANIYNSHAGATEVALQLSGIEVPGATSIRVVSSYYGIGTAAAFVFGPENESTNSVVAAVQRRINSLQTPGVRIIASAGVKVQFDFEVIVFVKESTSGTERINIEEEVKRTIVSYFFDGTGDPLKTLSIKSIEYLIVSNPRLSKIASIRGNNRNIFNRIYVRKSYGGSRATGERTTLDVNNYRLEENEYGGPGTINITFEEVSEDI